MSTVIKTLKSSGLDNYQPKFLIPVLLRRKSANVFYKLAITGYEPLYKSNYELNFQGENIVCEFDEFHATDSDNKPHCVDCGTNAELFLRLAEVKTNHRIYTANDGERYPEYRPGERHPEGYHRASKEEIIEMYKRIYAIDVED